MKMITNQENLHKKALACFLAVVVVFGCAPSAWADESADTIVTPAAADGASAAGDNDYIDGEPADEATVAELGEMDGVTTDAVPSPGMRATSDITDEEITQYMAGLSSDGSASLLSEDAVLPTSGTGTIHEFAGEDRFETAALQAQHGWAASRYAIIAGENGWPDALAASSLAGALDCPVLLTRAGSLLPVVSDTLDQLGVTDVLIVGGEPSVDPTVVTALEAKGITVTRLSGGTRFDTQLAIYQYGVDNDLWTSDAVAVGSGAYFTDTLSFAPVAFSQAIPIFLTTEDGTFTENQKRALIAGAESDNLFGSSILLGGENRVTAETEGFLWMVSLLSSGASKASTRLGGDNRYLTSARIASWAVENGYSSWNNAAFATGLSPNDALGGGALQGKQGSVLLLVPEERGNNPTLNALVASGATVDTIKIFGGTTSVTTQVRGEIFAGLGFLSVTYTDYNISIDELLELEWAARPNTSTFTKEEMRSAIDPDSAPLGTNASYQYARLDSGYSGVLTAAQLDAFIAANVGYQEAHNGVTSKLRGTGAYFIEAARTYGVNEVYLLAHAILESGWGCSPLSQGTVVGYEGYLNFYGIGAHDLDPENAGAALAKSEGWTDSYKAIMGAASWIKRNYIVPTISSAAISGPQNTLYKMKWDLNRAVYDGTVWHQYATSVTWKDSIARLMGQCYDTYDIPINKTGLTFDVPRLR